MVAEYLTEEQFAEGCEGYIRYCGGVAVLQFPDYFWELHNVPDEVEENPVAVIEVAEHLMLTGIRRVIWAAQRPGVVNLKIAEKCFVESELAMHEIVRYGCTYHEERLAYLNPNFPILRPAPFLNGEIYRSMCHANFDRITTLELMDGFQPDPRLLPELGTRKFSPTSTASA